MTEVGSVPVYRGNLEKLMRKIMQERGLDLSQYRRAYVERRLTARLRTLGLNTYRQYSYLLDSDPAEYDHLVNTLTINVTDFFRDGPVWDVLKHQVLPEFIAEKRRGRSRTIRVWSAGCATGEEPYSLAMAMRDVLGDNADEFLISVIGTDLDPKALAFAARGVYDSEKLGRIPHSYQVRFVRMSGVSEFEILPEVRRLVRFTPYNLFDGAPMRVVDLILCRNVAVAERIRSNVEAYRLEKPDRARVLRTVSIGVASFPEHAGTAPQLLELADQAMYRAKRAGKNRVESARA